jgi:hypothetical protein
MSIAVMNPTSRIVIAGHIAEWRRQSHSSDELNMLGDLHQPFGRTGTRAAASRWFWQR